MHEPAAATPSSATRGFASLLAALTTPVAESSPTWDEIARVDDIATLSYEQALRTHARFRPNLVGDPLPRPDHESGEFRMPPEPFSPENRFASLNAASLEPNDNATLNSSPSHTPMALQENRRAASITIRLSRAETVQLRARAAEAGLTISAYLRSCIFEAEALRAQVREALAQFRSASAASASMAPGITPSAASRSLSRFFPRWFTGRRAVHP